MLRGRITRALRQAQMQKGSTCNSVSHVKGLVTLPRLPVPNLRKTLDRYLTSLEPLLLEDELRGGMLFEDAFALRRKWTNDFESGIGQVLQERLIGSSAGQFCLSLSVLKCSEALDNESPHNWLDDNFWTRKAYLEWRAPLLVNSNWWLTFHDDKTIPLNALDEQLSDNIAGITHWQVRRATWLVHRVLDFKRQLDTQELYSDKTRTGIWLRETTSRLFNIARVPKPHCDVLSSPPPPSPPVFKLLLMIHNWCYTVDMYHPPDSPSSMPSLLNPHEIEARIKAVVLDVEQRLSKGETAFPIGALSADERDRWAKNLDHLLSIHPTNKRNHRAMLTSLMGLSLDHTTYALPPTHSQRGNDDLKQRNLDAHLHTIRSNYLNFANRFFDKPFTLIVDPSTRAGATGEHSPCDALVPSIVAEYGIVESVDPMAFENSSISGGWERLEWITDDKIQRECAAAQARALSVIHDSDDSVLWFEGYGTDWIKGVAKLTPDAYIQMVLQLAWYKTRGEFTATYETVLTRMFKHGRTETLRTLTTDSRAWVLAMMDPHSSLSTRYLTLQRAIETHCRLTKEAATGKGIDRHLLGLKLMLRPQDGERAVFFEDEIFERSQRWKLSTSGLNAGRLFKGTGFGAVFDDGYGINYLAAPDMIKFGIESKFSSPLTSTDGLKRAIVHSLDEMRTVCSSPEVPTAHNIVACL